MDEEMQHMRDRLMKLETIVGVTPDEGIRSDMREIKAALDALQAKVLLAIGGGSVLISVVHVAVQFVAR